MTSRSRRIVTAVRGYLTVTRIALLLVFGAGLAVIASVDAVVIRLIGAAMAVGALLVLLAQVDARSGGSRRSGGRSVDKAGARAGDKDRHRSKQHRDRRGESSGPVGSPTGPPIVSVIIPGRDEQAYAADCITSLQRQTMRQFEAIIVDDGSTDATLEVVTAAIGDDPRFRVVQTRSSIGPGPARNLGVALASAQYVTFLDLDDFLHEDSLRSRLAQLQGLADEPWIAGVFCWHAPVPRSETPDSWEPPERRAPTGPISWLNRHDDNVFVVSAPLLRRDAFEAVGGFEDAIGEDPRLWFKMLRAGFVFRGTGRVDIAYRQKPRSRYAGIFVEMGHDIADLVTEGEAAAEAPPGVDGPFWFGEPLATYRASLARARRVTASLGMAVALGDDDAARTLLDQLDNLPSPVLGWELDGVGHAVNGARRTALAGDDSPFFAEWARTIERLLQPVVDRARDRGGRWRSRPHPELPHADELPTLVRVRRHRRIAATPATLSAVVEGQRPFLILPSAAYHTDELIDLVPALRDRGLTPFAMVNDARWATTGEALSRIDVTVLDALPAGDWLSGLAGLLTFNDWGEYYAEYVRFLADSPVPTFAKVEGVQDWLDVDTARQRNAYLGADVVLCQGDNDVAALSSRRGRLEVVGSERLERAWRAPLPPDAEPSVVANVNFTYGVLTEHRDLWVETVRAAADEAGLPLALSMHPSETASYPMLAAAQPLRHLLTTHSILVTRFSTVVFEAMARGTSVIYHNPHGERVDTFTRPEGAFAVTTSIAELAAAMRDARSIPRSQVKDRATGFFTRQVSMVDGATPATRTADAIERHLALRGDA